MVDFPHPFTTMINATEEDDGLTPVWPYTREAFGLGHSPSVHDVPADPPAGDGGPSELDGPDDPEPVMGLVVETAKVAWQKYFDVNRMISADPTVTGTLPVTLLAPTRKPGIDVGTGAHSFAAAARAEAAQEYERHLDALREET